MNRHLIASESAGRISLRMAQGVEEIAALADRPVDRQPTQPHAAGAVKDHDPQELADLLAYLKGEL